MKSFSKIAVIYPSYLYFSIILYTLKIEILTKVGNMKIEELLAPCPKCGSKDKIAHRKIIDNHRAHAEMDTVKCEECGYIFFVNDDMDPDEKRMLLRELNKIRT